MNYREFAAGLIGFGIGMSIMSLMVILIPDTPHSMAMKAIEECELNIPRNQHCKIIAVIKEE